MQRSTLIDLLKSVFVFSFFIVVIIKSSIKYTICIYVYISIQCIYS